MPFLALRNGEVPLHQAILMSRLDVPVNAITSGQKRDGFSTKKP